MTRETTIIKLASSFGESLMHFVVGLAFMGGGGWLMYYAVHQKPQNDKLLYVGIGLAVFGAWIMPTIATSIRSAIVVVQSFPVVGPMLGGRRATDTPTPPGPQP